jgi:ATP-dependent HslUV protease subunit HslV
MDKNKTIIRATTVVCVRDDKSVVIASDGQVTLGTSVIKSNANKIRTFHNDQIIVGFAGSTADALTLFDRLEKKCEEFSYNLKRACVELAKDWRTDRYLRRLESMIIAADKNETFLISAGKYLTLIFGGLHSEQTRPSNSFLDGSRHSPPICSLACFSAILISS